MAPIPTLDDLHHISRKRDQNPITRLTLLLQSFQEEHLERERFADPLNWVNVFVEKTLLNPKRDNPEFVTNDQQSSKRQDSGPVERMSLRAYHAEYGM